MFHAFLSVVLSNFSFWLIFLLLAGFGLWRHFRQPDNLVWPETLIYLALSFFVPFVLYLIFYTTTTNVSDQCINSGHVQTATYEESWTEEQIVTVTDSKGNTHTEIHYIYHPPEWELNTSDGGSIEISRAEYLSYVNKFRNEKEIDSSHADQSSVGDGRTFQVSYNGNPSNLVPSSSHYSYTNLIKGSNYTIKKWHLDLSKYSKNFIPYPGIYDKGLGPISTNHILVSGVNVPKDWLDSMNWDLALLNDEIGASKQGHVVVYIVNSPDRNFARALEQYWQGLKKNDILVVIGSSSYPKIDWVEVDAFTDNEGFKIRLRDNLSNIKDLSDRASLMSTIHKQIYDGQEGYNWKRKSMKDYLYLVKDLELPTWAQILIIILSLGICIGLDVFFEQQDPFNRY